MFTGIISDIGVIMAAEKSGGGMSLAIGCHYHWRSMPVGASIAVNGVCLTVTGHGRKNNTLLSDPRDSWFSADLSPETIDRTALRWIAGESVNLERALKAGDALDGHMVTGHVDGVATLLDSFPAGGGSRVLHMKAPAALAPFLAEKGSVALDGVSLTVNKAEGDEFWVNIIPHTWNATTMNERKANDTLNIEIDPIARYVARLMKG